MSNTENQFKIVQIYNDDDGVQWSASYTEKEFNKLIKKSKIFAIRSGNVVDGKEFKLGDTITSRLNAEPFIISEIEDVGSCFIAKSAELDYLVDLRLADKIKKPLIITEDGVGLYCDKPCFPIIDNSVHAAIVRHTDRQYNLKHKVFSTAEKAEEYIYENEKRFSIKDIKTIGMQTLLKLLENE